VFSFAVLASGSSGNATLVRGPHGVILVECGLSYKELGKRFAAVGFDASELRGVLVSHEHGDHVSGASLVARRLGIPVYLSKGTHAGSVKRWKGQEELIHINAEDEFELAGITVKPFPVLHDTREPLQFRFNYNGKSLASLTDLGCADTTVEYRLQDLDSIILESNHDRDLLVNGSYPWTIKQRVLGSRGHLSNDQSALLLSSIATDKLQHIVLAHLSQDNNKPELARNCALEVIEENRLQQNLLQIARQSEVLEWMNIE
jgi:phosphoribosyl 1,2-cyclic phosphodiesterase